MFKKTMLFATVAIAAIAFAIPAVASAWTEKGAPLTENKTIPTSGSASFTGSLGGVNCTKNATATLTLKASSNEATVDHFKPNIADCDLTGGLAGVCTALTEVHVGTEFAAHNNGTVATITGVHLTNTFSGGFLCPKTITLSGNVTATPDPSTSAISSLTLSGSLAASVGGNVTVGGTFTPVNASDVGTYGF